MSIFVRLKVYLSEQETFKANALDKWQHTHQETTDLIDICQSMVDGIDDNPQTQEDVEKELAKTKVCESSCGKF